MEGLKLLHPSVILYAEVTEWQTFGNVLRFFSQKEEQLTLSSQETQLVCLGCWSMFTDQEQTHWVKSLGDVTQSDIVGSNGADPYTKLELVL